MAQKSDDQIQGGLNKKDELLQKIEALEKEVKEAHDHALWEAEMMSNILLSNGSHIAISKVYFNGLFNDENYKDRVPTPTTNEAAIITKAKFEALEKEVEELKESNSERQLIMQQLQDKIKQLSKDSRNLLNY